MATKREEQKADTRRRILDVSGRAFRQHGYGGAGVDGLAKAAGVTSGAFYAHFGSKAQAFDEAVADGMAQLVQGIRYFQTTFGTHWWPEFVRFYLGAKRTCDLSDACTLQTLPIELARSGDAAKTGFEQALAQVVATLVEGPPCVGSPHDLPSAYAALSTLIGAVTLARAVATPEVAAAMAQAAECALLGRAARE